jgi:chaperone required for assembly of F1-ATPase
MKRFYKEVTVTDGPYQILLDGRPVKTPMRAALALPTKALGEAVAAEWRSQGDEIDPHSMPLTKLANTAIDRVAGHEAAVIDQIMGYTTDLLCYRAGHPAALVARQSAEWDPILAWAGESLGAHLEARTGIVHFAQPPEAVAALRLAVAAYDPAVLAALHHTATILGSLVLALAMAAGRLTAAEAFALSQLDDRFQVEQWGVDCEAAARAAALAADLAATERFIRLAKCF